MAKSLSTTPLIAALHRLRMTHTADSSIALKEIKEIIWGGADLDESDASGMTPLKFFYTNQRAIKATNGSNGHRYSFIIALSYLVDQGVNTLSNNGEFFKKAPYSYQLSAMNNLPGTSNKTIDAFLTCSENLSLDWVEMVMQQNCVERNPGWLTNTRKSDGKTLLHIVWGHLVPNMIKSVSPQNAYLASEHAWGITQKAHALGADLYAMDERGETPCEIIANLISQGITNPLHTDNSTLFNEILSNGEAKTLQDTTRSVAKRGRIGRL